MPEPVPDSPLPLRGAPEEVFPLVYAELRRIAARFLRGERHGHTLDSTALVHEAYLRLEGQDRLQDATRSQFLALAAQMMRRILVDHARRRGRVKRGKDWNRVTLGGAASSVGEFEVDLLDLDQCLERLAELEERQAKVVELRFFGGLDVEETAEVLGVSKRTVNNDWRFARAWLRRELESLGS